VFAFLTLRGIFNANGEGRVQSRKGAKGIEFYEESRKGGINFGNHLFLTSSRPNFKPHHRPGYRYELVAGLSLPERREHFPGTRPDEDGLPTPHTSKARLQEYLSDPPISEQEATDGNPKAAP